MDATQTQSGIDRVTRAAANHAECSGWAPALRCNTPWRDGRRAELQDSVDRVLARTRGIHRQYRHASKPGTITVAGKPSLDVPRGTLNVILKQAGLKKEN